VWIGTMRAYDPRAGRYLDLSIGDTPRVFTIMWNGKRTLVIGFGCKNGGVYLLRGSGGAGLAPPPPSYGPPPRPLHPPPAKRTLALPSPIGGLQTGCATDGQRVYTNGIDAIQLGTQDSSAKSRPPTAGRVVSISLDTREEQWRHERSKVAAVGVHKNVGD